MDKYGTIIAIVFAISLIVSILSIIFRKAFRLGLVILAIVIIGSIGFIWLPKKVEQVTSGQTTTTEVMNDVVNGDPSMSEAIDEGSHHAINITEKLINSFIEWYHGE